jgi:hypothetical protein
MQRRIFLLVLASLLMGATAGKLWADDDDDLTRIQVIVKNKAGKPVDHAAVRVVFEEGRSIKKFGGKIKTSWEIRTSQEGLVKIPAIPKGKILVQVMAKYYQTFGQEFQVEENERTIEVTLNPPQQQYSAH